MCTAARGYGIMEGEYFFPLGVSGRVLGCDV